MTKSRGIRVPKGTRSAWVEANRGKHFCGCGCGSPIPLVPSHFNTGIPRFLHGHNTRVAPTRPRKVLPAPRPCECGCGEFASPGKRFQPGHGSKGRVLSPASRAKIGAAHKGERNFNYGKPAHNRLPEKPRQPCKCGCGGLAGPGKEFLSGHNGRVPGRRRAPGPAAKAGKYLRTLTPNHPFANKGGYVAVHRLLLEDHLRKTGPESPHLVRVGWNLYLRPELVVHHVDGNPKNNRIDNLVALTSGEHVALHHRQGDIHRKN